MAPLPTSPPDHSASPKAKAHSVERWGKGRGGRPWQRKRARIFKRDCYLCQICKAQGRLTAVELHGPNHGVCDHILPTSQGGTDDETNLQTICQGCDKAKTLKESRV